MDEDFAQNFTEQFQCQVYGKDITECRFYAWSALEDAIGIIPRHHWKLLQMNHGIEIQKNPENPEEQSIRVICQALWVFDPDSEGGKGAELFGPETPDPDGEEIPPELHLAEQQTN